ncbi:MAG: toprim domain-containing protein, partial [Clostridia bacterium]|nr:toprim domain-containing protein [Clostridia bacterium]
LGGRLIIPVIDQFGNVVAFVGRRIDGGKEQKYINTRETIAFSKGRTFFNINNLKKLKNEKGLDSVIMVEGHLDVVSLYQAGICNVVATMGTALTKDQARILKRYADKVYISYDGDFAGQKAAIRGLEILSEEGLEVKVVSLPDGMDPDDVIKNMGADGYRNLLAEAMPLIDFKLDILKRTYDVSTVDGKRKYVTNALKVVRESASSAEQEDLLKVIRDQTKITFEALKRELYSIEDKPREEKIVTPQFNDNVGDKTAIAARFILAAYLFSKPYAKETDISELEFNASVYKEIQQYIKEKYSAGQRPQFSDLYELLEDEYSEEISRIAGMEAEENKNFDHAAYFFDCVRTLKRDAIDKKIAKLSEMFESEIDTEKRGNLTAEMTRLLIEKRKLI